MTDEAFIPRKDPSRRAVQVIVVQHLLTDSLDPDQPLSLVNQII